VTDDDAIAYYTGLLARQEVLAEALCWTVIEPVTGPVTVESVAGRLGADPAGIRELPWDAAYDLDAGGAQVVHLGQAGRSVMMLEANGFQGAGESARALSEGARVHSAYWNVNAVSSLSCAALGSLLVTFEGLFPDRRQGLDIGALDEELDPLYAALSPPRSDFRPVIMGIVERRTGVRLSAEWLAADRPAIVLPDGSPPGGRAVAPGALFDPELESAVWLAPVGARNALAGDLVRLLAEVGRLGAEPEVRAALTAVASGVPRGDARYASLQELAARLTAAFDAAPWTIPVRDDPAWRRARAAEAIRLALAPPAEPPPWPLLNSLQQARLILGDNWLTVRTRLRAGLRRVVP
jgi:hypothetical protein